MENQNDNSVKVKTSLEKIRQKLSNKIIRYGIFGTTLFSSVYTANEFLMDSASKKEILMGSADVNYKKMKSVENLTFACIAHVENFEPAPYFCGAKWTIGYGSTLNEDGTPVKQFDSAISESVAKKYVLAHLEKSVYPFIKNYVKVKLSEEELIATALFIYNVGGKNFSGYNEDGEKVGEPSAFLEALNEGEKGEECAKKFTGFRASAGKLAKGLPKRHWVAGAIFTGKISPKQILMLEPGGFYAQEIDFYFKEKGGEKVEFYTPDYSKRKIDDFLEKNTKLKKSTLLIVDDDTRHEFLQDIAIAENFFDTNIGEIRKKISQKMAKIRIEHHKLQERAELKLAKTKNTYTKKLTSRVASRKREKV